MGADQERHQALLLPSHESWSSGSASPFFPLELTMIHVLATKQLSWTIGPASMALAQGVLPLELWVPWFNIVLFFVGTFINMQVRDSFYGKSCI